MHWKDVTAAPPRKLLKQFAILWLAFFVVIAIWRAARGDAGSWTIALATVGLVGGAIGLARPDWMRWIYTGWMIAVFPIGWTVSRLTLIALFYVVFMPVALLFRLMGRDALHLRRRDVRSYWAPKPGAANSREYLRQF
jgi:hypothetical protein